jgi:16S rRNA (cytosine967-C5)-methyltransferase
VREKEVFLRDLDSLHPSDRFSIPDHIYSKWENQFGEKNAALIAAHSNNPAKVTVRSNPLLGGLTNEDLSEVNATQIDDYDDFFEVQKLPMEALNSGRCYVQDPSTSIAPNLLNPQSTHTVLDACASPGGKTAIVAAKMSNQGKIIAADVEGPRSDRLIQNLERLGIGNTKIIRCDLRDEENRLKDEKLLFDKILLDVPCTNSGVFRRRPDAKWRLLPNSTKDMSKLQLHLVNSILPLLKKGGHLVYSTCSIDAEENTGVVSKLLETHDYLKKLDEVQLLPSENNDGAYAALIG